MNHYCCEYSLFLYGFQFNLETRTHFVKIHAPWAVLTKYAEIMNIKMPVKVTGRVLIAFHCTYYK